MLVKALGSFCIGGGIDVAEGDVFEAEDARVHEWLAVGHVERYTMPEPAPGSQEGSGSGESGTDDQAPPAHPDEGSGALAGGDQRPQHRDPASAVGRKPVVGRGRKRGGGRNAG